MPTPESFLPQFWQFFILLISPISAIIAVAVGITRKITSVEHKLEGRINLLDVRFSEHPLLTGYREFEKKQAVETIDGLLKKWEEENQTRTAKERED